MFHMTLFILSNYQMYFNRQHITLCLIRQLSQIYGSCRCNLVIATSAKILQLF